MHSTFHVDLFVILLMVMSAVAAAVKWVKVPYSVALVIIGLACGLLHLFPPVEMTPELILLVFLPALLFEASWNLDLAELKSNWQPITLLATVGVVISTVIMAFVMNYTAGLDLKIAFLFGSMIAATDPISVLALFRKMGMDKRLTLILEGESLFNDGTAVVLFKIILALVVSNTAFSFPQAATSFIISVLGGAIVGASVGYAASRLTRLFDDHLLEITLTTIVAYGSFLLAEQMKVSPVMAVLAAGIVVGNYGSRTSMSPTTRLAVNSFWEYAAFLVNSFVFLLIGLQMKGPLLLKYAPLIGYGIVAALIGRCVLIYGLTPFAQTKSKPVPFAWRHLLFWGGLRGSLSMALALSLPNTLPEREAIIVTTFGVVLFTLIVPGLTIEPFVKLLKVRPSKDKFSNYQRLKAQLIATNRTLEYISSQNAAGHLSKHAYELATEQLAQRQSDLHRSLDEMHLSDSSLRDVELLELLKTTLEMEKDCYVMLARNGLLTEEILAELKTNTNKALEEICQREAAALTEIDQHIAQEAEASEP